MKLTRYTVLLAWFLALDILVDFDIRFNTDIFAPGLKFTEAQETLSNDRQLAVDAARFLVNSMLPRFVS